MSQLSFDATTLLIQQKDHALSSYGMKNLAQFLTIDNPHSIKAADMLWNPNKLKLKDPQEIKSRVRKFYLEALKANHEESKAIAIHLLLTTPFQI